MRVTKVEVDKLKDKNEFLENECAELQSDNLDSFSDNDSNNESDDSNMYIHDEVQSNLQDIIGHHRYTLKIRKLYYTLLANEVPTSKIADIIRAVLKCFNPSLNSENLRLPKKACASYMHREELKTICDAHKATVLCSDSAKTRGIHLNTDGTTKEQRKLGGVIANSVVLGVNELPDGKAVSAIEDISRELEKLRKTAKHK